MSEPRGPRTNRPSGRRRAAAGGGGVAAEAANSTVKGIVLILAAIVVGVLLLNVVDDGGDASIGEEPKATTTTTGAPGESTSTTADTTEMLPHDQIRIMVLNGRGEQGVAGTMTEALKGQGYTDAADPGNAEVRTGDVVACIAGLESEAAELAQLVGDNVEVTPFPNPLPSGVGADVECLVTLGTAAAA